MMSMIQSSAERARQMPRAVRLKQFALSFLQPTGLDYGSPPSVSTTSTSLPSLDSRKRHQLHVHLAPNHPVSKGNLVVLVNTKTRRTLPLYAPLHDTFAWGRSGTRTSTNCVVPFWSGCNACM